MAYVLSHLPLPDESILERVSILKQCNVASRSLAELKGAARTIPNETILVSALTLQEAKDSSEVENIVTTHDELFKASIFNKYIKNPAAKEVKNYAEALTAGFATVRRHGIIRLTDILEIQETLERNRAGLRKLPGTDLKNLETGELVYTPPQDCNEVARLMDNLIDYVNDNDMSKLDPLIKMAVIHHQFESIHPFYDGNGRTGRILNILYLVGQGLLELPILSLSRYIIRHKSMYYETLQGVRDQDDWESWILFILKGVEVTANESITLIAAIDELMMRCKHRMREELPRIYSQDLLNNLFQHPYTKIDFVMNELQVSRVTAAKYLEALVERGFLVKHKLGTHNYYINSPLFTLLTGNDSP